MGDNDVIGEILDTGIKTVRVIKPYADRDKIFDRFFTADRAHTAGKGTGLGLSICKRIMDMHGQSIRLLDTDEGAAFQFTLERAEK